MVPARDLDPLVRVPASSANLGPGLDVLGLALSLHVTAGCGPAPDGAQRADEHHPAAVAFRAAGGRDDLWVAAPIPMGRGLGYSGAVRVAGATLALAQHRAWDGPLPLDVAAEVVELTGRLEGHLDNVAASVHGGVVVCAGGVVLPVPIGVDAEVVVWVPDRVTTSTDRSRVALPDLVGRVDAVFNLGRVGLLVAALAAGRTDLLATAVEDRLHQPGRLERVPDSADALRLGGELGAWCGWLSGSGPSVALLCDPSSSAGVAAGLDTALGDRGHTRRLAIDTVGATVVRRSSE